jgi:ribosomal protein L24
MKSNKYKVGNEVQMMSGSYKEVRGDIMSIRHHRGKLQLKVKGVNLLKRHYTVENGGIIYEEGWVDHSNAFAINYVYLVSYSDLSKTVDIVRSVTDLDNSTIVSKILGTLPAKLPVKVPYKTKEMINYIEDKTYCDLRENLE